MYWPCVQEDWVPSVTERLAPLTHRVFGRTRPIEMKGLEDQTHSGVCAQRPAIIGPMKEAVCRTVRRLSSQINQSALVSVAVNCTPANRVVRKYEQPDCTR